MGYMYQYWSAQWHSQIAIVPNSPIPSTILRHNSWARVRLCNTWYWHYRHTLDPGHTLMSTGTQVFTGISIPCRIRWPWAAVSDIWFPTTPLFSLPASPTHEDIIDGICVDMHLHVHNWTSLLHPNSVKDKDNSWRQQLIRGVGCTLSKWYIGDSSECHSALCCVRTLCIFYRSTFSGCREIVLPLLSNDVSRGK